MKKLFSLAIAASCLLANFINAEQTLSIIKPDAVKNHHIGDIIARFESEKIDVVGFHGQTISHNPSSGYSWQIGNAQNLSKTN